MKLCDRFLFQLLFFCKNKKPRGPPIPPPPPPAAPPAAPFARINAGGGTLDAAGTGAGAGWSADAYYGGRGTAHGTAETPCAVAKTDPGNSAALYCTHRYYQTTTEAPPYAYNIPVPEAAASYQVRLHFAEIVRPFCLRCQV